MTRILIVEDSRTFSSVLARSIGQELGFETRIASTMAQAAEILAEDRDFLAALLDINLPDAQNGEAVDLVVGLGIPSIIFTGEMGDEVRDRFWSKRIVDYVLKSTQENVSHVLSLLRRLGRNPDITVLVVDDSRSARTFVADLLKIHRYAVLEAGDGEEALALLEGHPHVRLVISDYNMPGMNGFELVREIRRTRSRDQLAIIGFSSQGGTALSARFLKNGANDFLHKPFGSEEFYARVTQNIETLEHIAEIRDLADKDFLTRLHNRRYFFSAGERLLREAELGRRAVALAMLDVDHFKGVNDIHGHDAGDAVLRQLAGIMRQHFDGKGIVARLGGEEFCVLVAGEQEPEFLKSLEMLRRLIARSPVCCGTQCISCTVSIGLCSRGEGGLESMLKAADQALYQAKQEGRNRVCRAGG